VERSAGELALAVTDGPAAIPIVATTLADVAGVRVLEMGLRRPTLDDVFFALTGHAGDVDDDRPESREAA